MSELNLKSVRELLGEKFFVPDYQRGYRWTKTEVRNLLDDFHEFVSKDLCRQDFYCLQPLVVCKSQKKPGFWEVIDGQQRLTTIFLILQFVKDFLKRKGFELYSLEYETRQGSEKYLQNPTEEHRNDNFDYFNIFSAKEEIEKFFSENKDDDLEFLRILTNSNETGGNVQFIWYDVTDEVREGKEKPVDIFTRLNIGKIPLTNAELIKALFLNKRYLPENAETANEVQSRIAQNWDEMQQKLEDNDFWFFIHGNGNFKYQTRIELLFDLLSKNEHKNDEEERWTFNQIYKDFEKGDSKNSSSKLQNLHAKSENLWKKVRKLFITLENWHSDRILYHLVGFNTATGTSISEILELFEKSKSNSDFKKNLLEKAKEKCGLQNKSEIKISDVIENLSYDEKDDSGKIKNILLLFNVLSLLKNQKSNDRFPFQFYLCENWDIEHISPQTDQDISGADRKSFLETNISYFTGADLSKQAFLENAENNLPNDEKAKEITENLINLYRILDEKKVKEDEKNLQMNEILEKLEKYFGNDELEDKDKISNLALLDSSTNRMYKNAFFPVKRYWIIQQEKNGKFIPLCTKNVFMKAYSKDFSQLASWTQRDADSYLAEIEDVLANASIENGETKND